MNRINIFTTILVSLAPLLSAGEFDDLSFGAGLIDQHIGTYQTAASGGTNKLEVRPFLTASGQYRIADSWALVPEFGLVVPGSENDENISKLTYWFNLYGRYYFKDFSFRAGVGFSLTRISADGGTVSLQNGTGNTEFHLPNRSSTTRNLTTNLGVDYTFTPNWSAKFDAHIFNLEESEDRSWSALLSINYHFYKELWE